VVHQLHGQFGAGQVEHFHKVGFKGEQRCHHQVERVLPGRLGELAIKAGIGSRSGQGGWFPAGEFASGGEHFSEDLAAVLRGFKRVETLGFQGIEQLRKAGIAVAAAGE
jgi:hypothetical protein